ncbi:ETX/MTX2 family pore-forming toxin [Streptomyces sp. NPDC047028]|uniref:ETX/MTX2 family pore-forming toxin n=1 Tax=Streptomyces sp. NPDC047028 TaxID=3155793 RepID=UPI0033F4AA36
MNGALKVVAAIVPVSLGMSILVPTTAHAEAPTIVNLNDVTGTQAIYYAGYAEPNGQLMSQDTSRISSANASAVPVGVEQTSPADTWYVGSTTLNNPSDYPQTMTTQSFSRAINTTLSTTLTTGLSTTTTAKFAAPAGGAGVDLAQTISFSQAETQTTSDQQTYTASAQNILVPPHMKAQVYVVLQSVKAVGNIGLHADLIGNGDYKVKNCSPPSNDACIGQNLTNVPLYDLLGPNTKYGTAKYHPPALPSTFSLNPATRTVIFDGTGKYTATYGTDMSVSVDLTPIDAQSGDSSSQPAPTPYSYSVTPKVSG